MCVDGLVGVLPGDEEVVGVHGWVELCQAAHHAEVGGEEDEGGAAQQLLADGPADSAARLHRRPAAQLVQDYEGGGPAVCQQVRRLLHLQHELSRWKKSFWKNEIHCKKGYLAISPSPAGMSLTKLSLAGKTLIVPGQGEFSECHPGWGRKNR